MVRINLINPKKLADQHLIAEYNEILMLLGYVRKYPQIREMPLKYCLGEGHILFFKNKLIYLKKRHELLKKEMLRRGFHPHKKIDLKYYPKNLKKDWTPSESDLPLIKNRLIQKIKQKPDYYTYRGKKQSLNFFIKLINTE